MADRIYSVARVGDDVNTAPRLVRASTKTGALRHVAEHEFHVQVANQETLVQCLSAGVIVEDAGEVPAELQAETVPAE